MNKQFVFLLFFLSHILLYSSSSSQDFVLVSHPNQPKNQKGIKQLESDDEIAFNIMQSNLKSVQETLACIVTISERSSLLEENDKTKIKKIHQTLEKILVKFTNTHTNPPTQQPPKKEQKLTSLESSEEFFSQSFLTFQRITSQQIQSPIQTTNDQDL